MMCDGGSRLRSIGNLKAMVGITRAARLKQEMETSVLTSAAFLAWTSIVRLREKAAEEATAVKRWAAEFDEHVARYKEELRSWRERLVLSDAHEALEKTRKMQRAVEAQRRAVDAARDAAYDSAFNKAQIYLSVLEGLPWGGGSIEDDTVPTMRFDFEEDAVPFSAPLGAGLPAPRLGCQLASEVNAGYGDKMWCEPLSAVRAADDMRAFAAWALAKGALVASQMMDAVVVARQRAGRTAGVPTDTGSAPSIEGRALAAAAIFDSATGALLSSTRYSSPEQLNITLSGIPASEILALRDMVRWSM